MAGQTALIAVASWLDAEICSRIHVSLVDMRSKAPESNGYLCDAVVVAVVVLVVALLVTFVAEQVTPIVVVDASAACTVAANAANVAVAVHVAGGC